MDERIYNPATKRYVNLYGKIGKILLKDQKIKNLQDTCNNEYDPISLDKFADMSLEDIESIIYVGEGPKKNGYLLRNIYEVYKLAVICNKLPRDPMNPSYYLTYEEIDKINEFMRKTTPSYEPPKFIEKKEYPEGYELVIKECFAHSSCFEITINYLEEVEFHLGLIPGWVETCHTGSSDITSAVLLSNIRELWEKKIMMEVTGRSIHKKLKLKKSFGYWVSENWKQRFIFMCNNIKELLED
jgi:hypothetical protein